MHSAPPRRDPTRLHTPLRRGHWASVHFEAAMETITMHAFNQVRGFICRFVLGIFTVALLLGLGSCGSGSNNVAPPPPPPPAISVSITSAPAGVNAGLSYRFVATVLHATNTAVTWSVACSSSCTGVDTGAIAADGTYTAPSSAAQPVDLIVMATSVADTSKSDSARFSLMPAIQISMLHAPSQIVLGFVQQFSADVQNDLDTRGVEWSVGGVPGGNAALGTIDSAGVYSAPSGSSEMTVAIAAKSVTDPTKTASANVDLIANTHPNFTGDYTFSFSGPDGLGLTAAAGTIHLDGSGRVSSTLDINSSLNNNVLLSGLSLTGFYGFEHNNLGHATLSYVVGQQTQTMSFRLALLSDQTARVIEFDGQGQGTGLIEKRAGSGLNTSLNGPRVLALNGLNTGGQYNPQVTILGTFSGGSGALSGIYDTVGFDQTPLTGTYTFGNTNTLSINFQGWNSSVPVTFRVHPISPDKAVVISTGMPVLTGVIERQTGGPYSLAAFSGTWGFLLKSTDSSFHLAGVRLVRIQADGSGVNAVGDMFSNNDYNPLDGPPYPVTFNRYYVAENGRGNANVQFVMPEPVVWYWVTPQRGYIMSAEGYGEFYLQKDAPFTLASLQAPLSFVLSGFSDYFFLPRADYRLGVGTPDGNGNFVLTTSDFDAKDVAETLKMDVTRTGTYTIESGGRGIISLDNGQLVLRFYALSDTTLLLMRPGYDVIGAGTAEQPAQQ